MNRRMGLSVLGVVIIALAATVGFVATAHSMSKPKDGAPVWLVAQAERVAATNGDPAPTAAAYCLTTRRKVFDAIGEPDQPATVADVPVYLVVLTGHFVDEKSFAPPGAPAPQGTTLVYAADAHTRGVLDFGLQDGPIDTKAVGPMTSFTVP